MSKRNSERKGKERRSQIKAGPSSCEISDRKEKRHRNSNKGNQSSNSLRLISFGGNILPKAADRFIGFIGTIEKRALRNIIVRTTKLFESSSLLMNFRYLTIPCRNDHRTQTIFTINKKNSNLSNREHRSVDRTSSIDSPLRIRFRNVNGLIFHRKFLTNRN